MEHSANEQLPPIGSCYGGANDHMAVVRVHLGQHRLIGMNVLDSDDLIKTKHKGRIMNKMTTCGYIC